MININLEAKIKPTSVTSPFAHKIYEAYLPVTFSIFH